MKNPFSCGLYETAVMQSVTGETLRPGGLQLTKRAADLLCIQPGKKILDSGCGQGSSMEFLRDEYMADVKGIDVSAAMVKAAKNKGLKATLGASENFPFADNCFEIVLSECSLSHSRSICASFREFNRVLVKNGFLAICDLCAKEETATGYFTGNDTADTGILSAGEIKTITIEAGFKIIIFEDHTPLLTQLICDIIMKYGSIEDFFNAAANEGYVCNNENPGNIKFGYFLIIAEKQ